MNKDVAFPTVQSVEEVVYHHMRGCAVGINYSLALRDTKDILGCKILSPTEFDAMVKARIGDGGGPRRKAQL